MVLGLDNLLNAHFYLLLCEEARSFKSRPRTQSSAEAGSAPASRYVLSVVSHSDDYVSLLMPFLDVPEGLGSLFQRIASIDDRFQLSRLNKLF
jgi:hypothetical protein